MFGQVCTLIKVLCLTEQGTVTLAWKLHLPQPFSIDFLQAAWIFHLLQYLHLNLVSMSWKHYGKFNLVISAKHPPWLDSQDMNPGPQGVRSLANLGSLCQDMKPGPQGLPGLAKVGSPCQDMKPGRQELSFRKNSDLHVRTWNLVHRANWCTTISTTGPI